LLINFKDGLSSTYLQIELVRFAAVNKAELDGFVSQQSLNLAKAFDLTGLSGQTAEGVAVSRRQSFQRL